MNNFNDLKSKRATTKLPPYIIASAGLMGTAGVYSYWLFSDYVPITKRRRLLATSMEWEKQLGDQEYQKLIKQYRGKILPKQHRASVTVQRVGSRIGDSVKRLLDQDRERSMTEASGNGKRSGISSSSGKLGNPKYTFTVVRSDVANAFVLPNNHVFLFTGLFKFVSDEDELAAVLGHEMAHNVARHAGERMSESIFIAVMARMTLLLDPSGILYTIFLPTATLLHTLPHSREHEAEADYIGMQISTDACYDPKAVRRVFAKMKAMEGGEKGKNPPEFVSTHPSYDTRLSNFDDWMPDANKKYNSVDRNCQLVRQQMKSARQLAAINATQGEQQSSI